MSEKLKRPNIAELEAMLNGPEQENIKILPNGDVVRLTPEEQVRTELQTALETVAALRGEANKLRDGLKRIVSELEELLP